MATHLLRALVYHSPMVVAGIFAVGAQAADRTEHEEIFMTTLNECVNKKSNELSGWDRIVYSFYYHADSAQRCRTEITATFKVMEDSNYMEKQAADSEYRKRLTRVSTLKGQDSGKLKSLGLGSSFNVITYDPDKNQRLESRAETPIKTAPGYLTKSGDGE